MAHHYAAATSLLLEEQLIDTVVFTHYDRGSALNYEPLRTFSHKDIFLAGGYKGYKKGRCIDGSLSQLYNLANSGGQIYAVSDLIINSPDDWNESDPSINYSGGFPCSKTVTSDMLIKEIGSKSKMKDNRHKTKIFRFLSRSAYSP